MIKKLLMTSLLSVSSLTFAFTDSSDDGSNFITENPKLQFLKKECEQTLNLNLLELKQLILNKIDTLKVEHITSEGYLAGIQMSAVYDYLSTTFDHENLLDEKEFKKGLFTYEKIPFSQQQLDNLAYCTGFFYGQITKYLAEHKIQPALGLKDRKNYLLGLQDICEGNPPRITEEEMHQDLNKLNGERGTFHDNKMKIEADFKDFYYSSAYLSQEEDLFRIYGESLTEEEFYRLPKEMCIQGVKDAMSTEKLDLSKKNLGFNLAYFLSRGINDKHLEYFELGYNDCSLLSSSQKKLCLDLFQADLKLSDIIEDYDKENIPTKELESFRAQLLSLKKTYLEN